MGVAGKGWGKGARGEQLITNQGQEWIDIRTTITRKGFSKQVKRGLMHSEKGGNEMN
jgi:hypothetical protein